MTENGTKSPREILELTRTIFAASHWIEGHYTSQIFVDNKAKAVGCSVGGLRYAALAPMDHALDEVWMVANFQELGESISYLENGGVPAAVSYLAAVEALAVEVNRPAYDYYVAQYGDEDVWHKIGQAEDIVINWNDSFQYNSEEERLVIVEREILPAFDRAIASLAAGEASPPQEEGSTT